MRARQHLLSCLLPSVLAGCVVHLPEPTSDGAGHDPAVLAELQTGLRLYVSKCTGCHSLYPVEELDAQEWEDAVGEMIRLKKVRLQPEEKQQLLKYLSTYAARKQ